MGVSPRRNSCIPLPSPNPEEAATMSNAVHPVDEILPAAEIVRAGPPACPCHVRQCRRGAADYRRCLASAERADRDADQCRPFRLRYRYLGSDDRVRSVRDPPAGHHGGHRSLDLADAGDGRHAGGGLERHLWRGAGRRAVRTAGGAVRAQSAALLPVGRHRLDHHHDRRVADAGRHRLGRRRCRVGRFRRRRIFRPSRPWCWWSSCW